MSYIKVNGIEIKTDGVNSSIIIQNGHVSVNGNHIDIGKDTQNIKIEGDVGQLKVTGRVEVTGEVGGNVDAGGSVTADNIEGDIDAGGSVSIKRR